MSSLLKKCIAEFVGTFVLVFFAVGTAVVTGNLVAVALSFGLVIVAMAYSIGRISGCHINPAVSLAMLVLKKMDVKEFIGYVIAQMLGALMGAALLYAIVSAMRFGSIGGCNAYIGGTSAEFGGILASLILEVVLTFVFVYVICNVVSNEKTGNMGGIIIGLTLTLVHLLGINLTGTSVNPARSFGPAIMAWIYGAGTEGLQMVWLFIVAPMLGGFLAAMFFAFLHKEDKNESKEEKVEVKEEESKEENKATNNQEA